MTIRPTDIRRHEISGKCRIGEMTFRENVVAPRSTHCFPLPCIPRKTMKMLEWTLAKFNALGTSKLYNFVPGRWCIFSRVIFDDLLLGGVQWTLHAAASVASYTRVPVATRYSLGIQRLSIACKPKYEITASIAKNGSENERFSILPVLYSSGTAVILTDALVLLYVRIRAANQVDRWTDSTTVCNILYLYTIINKSIALYQFGLHGV